MASYTDSEAEAGMCDIGMTSDYETKTLGENQVMFTTVKIKSEHTESDIYNETVTYSLAKDLHVQENINSHLETGRKSTCNLSTEIDHEDGRKSTLNMAMDIQIKTENETEFDREFSNDHEEDFGQHMIVSTKYESFSYQGTQNGVNSSEDSVTMVTCPSCAHRFSDYLQYLDHRLTCVEDVMDTTEGNEFEVKVEIDDVLPCDVLPCEDAHCTSLSVEFGKFAQGEECTADNQQV